MNLWQNKLFMSLFSALTSLILVATPVLLVCGSSQFFAYWPKVLFYILCFVGAGTAGYLGLNFAYGIKEVKEQRMFLLGSAIFLFLYVACSALCEKIHLSVLTPPWWKILGLIFVFIGGLIRLLSIATLGKYHSLMVTIQNNHQLICFGPYKWIRNPSYLGALIIFIGIPLIFGNWLPLLAIPGYFVALNWRINAEESLLKEKFGQEFEQYKRKTWRWLPFIY